MNRVQATALVRDVFDLDDSRVVGSLADVALGYRCDHCPNTAVVEVHTAIEVPHGLERDNTICCHDCAIDHLDALGYVPGLVEIVVTLHPDYATSAVQAA